METATEGPSDEMVLETAVNRSADHLATFNLRHFREAAALFGLEAAVPGRIWRKIRSNMRKSNAALRLQTSLSEEAKRVAASEGVA